MAAQRPSARRLRLLLQLAEALDALISEAVHNIGEEGGSQSPSNGTEAPPQSGAPEEATAGPSSGPEPKKTDPEAAEVAESAEPNEESPVAGHRPLKRQRTTADDPPSQGSTGSTQPWG